MVSLGGESIALVGQDLAYTNGKSHANAASGRQDVQGVIKVIDTH